MPLNITLLNAGITKQATTVAVSRWIPWQTADSMAVSKSDTQFLFKNKKMDIGSQTFIILVSFKKHCNTSSHKASKNKCFQHSDLQYNNSFRITASWYKMAIKGCPAFFL